MAAPVAAQKVTPKVTEDAARTGSAHVFVVLRGQPHARLLAGRQAGAARRDIEAALGPAQRAMAARLASYGARRIHPYTVMNLMAAEIPAAALPALEADPDVAAVWPVEEHLADLDVNVPATGAGAFWARGQTGAGESLVLLDSGMRSSHPAFAGKDVVSRVFGRFGSQSSCFGDDTATGEDMDGHGTHVAGILVSGDSLYQGMARGVSRFFNLKTGFRQRYVQGLCSGRASVNAADLLEAVEWAVFNTPAKVFNYSYGAALRTDDSPTARALDYVADTYGLTLVISAGNEGPEPNTVGNPGNAYNGITVANVDTARTVDRADDRISNSSSRGPLAGGRYKPDLAAPGTRIFSAAFDSDGFVTKSGTSMATPMVAGAAVLLRQAGITNPLAIKAVLLNSADGNGWTPDYGWGYLNLAEAAAHAAHVRTSISSGSAVYYRGRMNANSKATLVWNRHLPDLSGGAAQLNDLGLYLYSALNGTLLDRSDELNQNVEQVRAAAPVESVLKVRAAQFAGAEPFALAFGDTVFTSALPPSLRTGCTAPAAIAPNSTFNVTCEAANTGGLDAFAATGALALPEGFSGTAAQGFGVVPAGGRVTRVYQLRAASAPGVYRARITLASASFGEVFSASGDVSYTVVAGGGAALNVGGSTLALRARAGDGRATAAIPLSGTGGAFAFTATTAGGGWLSVVPAAGRVPATLTVSADPSSLAAGSYTGSVTVAAPGVSNSPQSVAVSFTVEQSAPSAVALRDKLMTRSVPQGGACAAPAAVGSFTTAEKQAFVWFSVVDATRGDRPSVEWYGPDGVLYQSGSWDPLTATSACLSSALEIAGKPAASKPGVWTVRVLWNGVPLFALPFSVVQPVVVERRLFTGAIPEGAACNLPEAAALFRVTEARIHFWFLVSAAAPGDRAEVTWLKPDGTVYRTDALRPLTNTRGCLWSTLEVAGTEAAGFPGIWTVKVDWNGAPVLSETVTLAPPVVIEKRMAARTLSGGCAEPDPVHDFLPWDARAYIWYSVQGQAGDVPSAEWYAPDGSLYFSTAWDALASSGNWCLWSWINVAEHAAASQFGDWTVKFYWNGVEANSLSFRIVPVAVDRRMTARVQPDSAACNAPEPWDRFLTSDARVWAWFSVQQARVGDRPRLQWIDPDGGLYGEFAFQPVNADGDWCFWNWMAVAGAEAAENPGAWNVTVWWNDLPLFTMPFEIRREGAGGDPGDEGGPGGAQTYVGPSRPPVSGEPAPGGQMGGAGSSQGR